jgi:hypothetical protein
MVTEILRYLSNNGLASILVFLLWSILADSKTLERLEKAKMRKLMYLPILGYYLQIIANILFIVKKWQ